MLSKDKILKETSPLSIFLVKSGSSGNRLLFRYPFDDNFQNDINNALLREPSLEQTDSSNPLEIIGENDEALCNMFSVNSNLCGQKFEIKINNVRHVGHPMSLLPPPPQSMVPSTPGSFNQQRPVHHQHPNLNLASYDCFTAPHNSHNTNQGDITSFNIVCSLRSTASFDIVDCYHDLSKRLAIALSFEERRCSYLSKEIKTIMATLEERDMDTLEDHQKQYQNSENASNPVNIIREDNRQKDSVFSLVLNRSNLAKDLKKVFVSMSTVGIVDLKINNWITVSFCLPQKVHRLKLITHESMPPISTQGIKRCLLYLRPYHSLLLLYEQQELLNSLPIDASPALIQLIKVAKPDKNLMDLSVDANLTLLQIFCIVSQLVYWSKATVMYPICDSNIYAIHPLASTGKNSNLAHEFQTRFPNSKSLHHYLADFSEGTSLSQINGPLLNLPEKLNLLNIVTWLLQKRILMQVHKYIFLLVDKEYNNESTNVNLSRSSNIASSELNQQSNITGVEISMHGANIQYNRFNGVKQFSMPSNSIETSPQICKNSFTDSFESSLRRCRTNSLPESQEDSNICMNSSLSSTPNSNLEYPSTYNDPNNRESSVSSSYPVDNSLVVGGTESALAMLKCAGLNQSAAKNVLAIPSSKNPEDLRLLIKLIPYFDGKHHIEDIMFFENLERSQVLILCDKFRDILFTCHYEDVAVSQLSPFENIR